MSHDIKEALYPLNILIIISVKLLSVKSCRDLIKVPCKNSPVLKSLILLNYFDLIPEHYGDPSILEDVTRS
jgi:hypothetical protein